MEKKLSNLLFIDRNNYVNILDKKFNINDLVDVITGVKTNERLSSLTTNILIEINDRLSKALFDSGFYHPDKFSVQYKQLSDADLKYASHYIKSTLTLNGGPVPFAEDKKYYELIPLANNDILVVIEEAFFDIITETKDKLKEFILECLCIQYKFNSNLELLMKLYLSIQINETTLNMVKLRFN